MATPETSYLVRCGESRAIMSNCSIKERHWSVQKKCGTCFLCSIVCLLSFLPTPCILKAEIEDHGDNVVAFCAGAQLDPGAKEHTYGMLQHDICNTGKK